MAISFSHHPHPHSAARQKSGPPKSTDQPVGLNDRIGLALTTIVGTMWCAYFFAVLALVALPESLGGGLLPLVEWLSQTFIQLVMLSVIMVGQGILGRAADRRSEMTFHDTDATLHETVQLQEHLLVQDEALNELLRKVAKLEDALGSA